MYQAKTMGAKMATLFALAVAAVLAVFATATSAHAFESANTNVIVSPTSKTIYVGSTYTLKSMDKNEEADKKALGEPSIKWTSSNSKVVSVNSKGTIKGLKAGSATVKVTYTYSKAGETDRVKSASCKVTVKKRNQNPKVVSSLYVKSKTLKKKAVSLTGTKISGAAGTRTWTKVSGCKGIKVYKGGTIKVNKKLTKCRCYKSAAKRYKKGSVHKIKVKVTCSGNYKYNAKTVYKTIYVRVK